jgi:NADH:ubiquinone oxidoreductase subunit K
MRTLLIVGTVLAAGTIAVGLAALVAWLRRRPS